jgi:hypothetical protein
MMTTPVRMGIVQTLSRLFVFDITDVLSMNI